MQYDSFEYGSEYLIYSPLFNCEINTSVYYTDSLGWKGTSTIKLEDEKKAPIAIYKRCSNQSVDYCALTNNQILVGR